jgi:hypothetical protein
MYVCAWKKESKNKKVPPLFFPGRVSRRVGGARRREGGKEDEGEGEGENENMFAS